MGGIVGRVRKDERKVLRFGPDICGDPAEATEREWLETNSIGGFASSTIAGLNTRRYHGLLVAATKPPVGRRVLLSKLEETLLVNGERFPLSANAYPGAIHPQGFRYLVEFRLDPYPIFRYSVEGVELEKHVYMTSGENTTTIRYDLLSSPENCQLEIRPLIAFRDYHALTHRNQTLDPKVALTNGTAALQPYPDLSRLFLSHNAARATVTGEWYLNFVYERERERGLDYREDLFQPVELLFDFETDPRASVVASIESRQVPAARPPAPKQVPPNPPLVEALWTAADQFLVRRREGMTIIAGYPWFSDWGRDTMIALPGLTLVTGRYEAAKGILRAFAETMSRGMLPNRFPDDGESPEYNTIDATLWFFEAARSYLAYTGDSDFIRQQIYPKLVDAFDWHLRGTRYGIRTDDDGLLRGGEPGVQLTWMDAKVGGWVVTPRIGKPVEIQALWFNALRILEEMAGKFNDADVGEAAGNAARKAAAAFLPQFWNAEAGCLYDVVADETKDPSIRPNQIFAISLGHSMLPANKAAEVVERVREHLLTPLGLRTLSPADPAYKGRFEGDMRSRDGAYHQGTVWPWLMGPFLTAYLRVNGHVEEARRQAREWLMPFEDHLSHAGLGQISEVADGDLPQRPGGCIAQAWSVGEILRATLEDVYASPASVVPYHGIGSV